jgi:hypothetical protein
MSNWTEKDGYRSKTLRSDKFIVTIHRPVLTEEEFLRREQMVVNALERYGKETLHQQAAAV